MTTILSDNPILKEWYHCMLKHYPAMNGRDCESSRQAYLISHPEINGDDAELIVDNLAADYSLTPDLIYAAFNWDFAEDVYKISRDEAFRLGLGFFDLTDNCVEFSPTESIRLPNEEEEKIEENLPSTETANINTPVEQSHTPKGIEHVAFRNQRYMLLATQKLLPACPFNDFINRAIRNELYHVSVSPYNPSNFI